MTTSDKAAPMASAPMKYASDGSVDWGNMWDNFCALPRAGGPPHRATLLEGDPNPDPSDPTYQAVADEIMRGITLVSRLPVFPAAPGWVALRCPHPGMAEWLAEAIREENVAARAEVEQVWLPVGAGYTLKGEIKNVVTAVAKTTHYWHTHLPQEIKNALAIQARLRNWWRTLVKITTSDRSSV